MNIPCDPDVANQLKLKIDPCPFQTVKRYFRNPSGQIKQVILVQEGYRLEEVAAFFCAPSDGSSEEQLRRLLKAGVMKFGVDDLERVHPDFVDCVVLLYSIADDRLCYVIYGPPAYFAQLSDQAWR